MIAHLRPLPLGLIAANLAMAALAALPWFMAGTPVARAPAAIAQEAPHLPPLPPLADLSATVERPLFSSDRRAPATARETSSIEERYRLQGLVIAGTARHALVAPTAGGRAQELAEGDAIDGWTVTRIEHDRVVLASPAGAATLKLAPSATPP